jgi:hypothetical protein
MRVMTMCPGTNISDIPSLGQRDYATLGKSFIYLSSCAGIMAAILYELLASISGTEQT